MIEVPPDGELEVWQIQSRSSCPHSLEAWTETRSNNGLILGANDFHKVVKAAGIRQEYITPYTSEQNGMIEHWVRTLKSELPLAEAVRNGDASEDGHR